MGEPEVALAANLFDVFLSHAGEDRAVAVRLRQALIDSGLRPWTSFVDIPVGAQYDEHIVHAIGDCHALVLVVSPSSMQSEHVYREVYQASSMRKRILPVYIESEVPIPFRMRYYIGSLHRLKVAPDVIESAGPRIAASLHDQEAWLREAVPPGALDRLSAAPLRLWGSAIAVVLVAGLAVWGMQAAWRQWRQAEISAQRDALPESLASLQILRAERTTINQPWRLSFSVTLAGPNSRFSDVRLILQSRDGEGKPYDLTPFLESTQVGFGQTLRVEVPRLGDAVIACLTMPHPRLGVRWRLSASFSGKHQTEEDGRESIKYFQNAQRAAQDDGSPCA